ncbi:mitochondrial 54S ribosomal protein YmL9 [Scheffersomyces xylosifermentans]|uniref:mitochondrial 54S ribosomal protein YmL9 n=1 Tax=Scheffersomyces xylosifermentans TaxID=1304137 RepID=UPI00315C9163
MNNSIWAVGRKSGSLFMGGNGLVFTRNVAQITSIHAIPSMRSEAPVINHSLEVSNLRKSLLGRPGLLGIKRGMITWFTEKGEQFAATVIEIDSCEVIKHKTLESDGYWSVLLGQVDKLKNVNEKELAKFAAAGVSPKQNIGEFRVRDESGLIPVGTELKADYFAVGQLVDVKAVSKGKGFAGVMKRHGFAGLNASHGVSKAHRSAGGMGGNQDPGRVLPGKKMAGRMGGNNCTVYNNEVLHADGEAGILVVKGQIPGPARAFVRVLDATKLYGKSLNDIKNGM